MGLVPKIGPSPKSISLIFLQHHSNLILDSKGGGGGHIFKKGLSLRYVLFFFRFFFPLLSGCNKVELFNGCFFFLLFFFQLSPEVQNFMPMLILLGKYCIRWLKPDTYRCRLIFKSLKHWHFIFMRELYMCIYFKKYSVIGLPRLRGGPFKCMILPFNMIYLLQNT